jgi:acyl-coenzyme A synthetase/AMP-(fatty) acid ligase/acyl carrier protein
VRLVQGSDYARFAPEEVFLQLAPLTFDASTFEIWGALLNGARLVLFPPHQPSLAELGAALERYEVTSLWLTAGLFHQMVEEQWESLRGLRQLLAGGEVLSPAHVQQAVQRLEGCQLINGYGPTENTTFTCCWPVPPAGVESGSVPIGGPIANTQVYVLDGQRQPVPIGVPGELYIGGDGLARGYLNQPQLTAEKFVPDPFSGTPGARLYQTGDRVRWLEDGTLEFLGRRDRQVKVRGYRIELEEIEAVLGRHPGVREAVVLVRADQPEQKRLVAYLVPNGGDAPDVRELRGFLQARLPEYMLPAAFVVLEALPLSPHGKIDRQAFPDLEPERPALGPAYAAPRTPVEEALVEIWAELLGLEQVGVDDDFFELGGHSLLVTRMVARVHRAFGVELPLRSLFEARTVAVLAVAIRQSLLNDVDTDKLAGLLAELEGPCDKEAQLRVRPEVLS